MVGVSSILGYSGSVSIVPASNFMIEFASLPVTPSPGLYTSAFVVASSSRGYLSVFAINWRTATLSDIVTSLSRFASP